MLNIQQEGMITVRAAVLRVFIEMHITQIGAIQSKVDDVAIKDETESGKDVSVSLTLSGKSVTKVTNGVGLLSNKTLFRQFFALPSQQLGVEDIR